MYSPMDVQPQQANKDDEIMSPFALCLLPSNVFMFVGVAFLLIAVLAVSQSCQAKPADNPTLRQTPLGQLEGVRTSAHDAWLGIPYAQPPIGDKRWKSPEAVTAWPKVRSARTLAAPCSQYNGYNTAQPLQGEEDCLYLNVWAPQYSPKQVPTGKARLPVMVWIHGGSNVLGHGGSYNGGTLAASQQAIIITINYRLGVFGWFNHPALFDTKTAPADASGNYALLDIIQALNWVKANISAFGGDPERVTVFGESAGAANTFSLLVSPLAKDLFQRVIIQSGGTASISPAEASHYVDDDEPGFSQSSGEVLLQLLINDGVASNRDTAKQWVSAQSQLTIAGYLRAKTPAEFHKVYQQRYLQSLLSGQPPRFPQQFRDGTVIPSGGIDDALQQGHFHHMPMILGSTRDEFSLLLAMNPLYTTRTNKAAGIRFRSRSHYQLAAEYLSKMLKARSVDEPADMISRQQTEDVFVYRFDWDLLSPAPWLNNLSLGATHGLDVPFVFGHRNLGPEFFQLSLMNDNSLASYRELSNAMMSYWVEFASSGNPAAGQKAQLPEWSAWSSHAKNQDRTMHFDSVFENYLRMSPLKLDTARVLEQLERDSRLKALPGKEQFMNDLLLTMKSFGLMPVDSELLSNLE